MKKDEMFIELWELSSPERYFQTAKITLPITYSLPFHGQCMNAAWCDLGNSPPGWKYWENVQA
jgi:hypothetical protein